jgi:hypothetical protein
MKHPKTFTVETRIQPDGNRGLPAGRATLTWRRGADGQISVMAVAVSSELSSPVFDRSVLVEDGKIVIDLNAAGAPLCVELLVPPTGSLWESVQATMLKFDRDHQHLLKAMLCTSSHFWMVSHFACKHFDLSPKTPKETLSKSEDWINTEVLCPA